MSDLLHTRRRLIAALATLPAWGRLPVAQAAPALLLARTASAGIDPTGYLVSEKYDGVRAFWDGRVLRFRSGAPIAAPDWFTQRLPALPLDGELWLERGRFEALSGLVRRQRADDAAWRGLRYMLFELPGAAAGPSWWRWSSRPSTRRTSCNAACSRCCTPVAKG